MRKKYFVDHINNPIEIDDVVMFTSIKQSRGLMIGRVISFSPKRLRVLNLQTLQRTTVHPKHAVVITQQIRYNLSEPCDGFHEGNSKGIGQTARGYLKDRGCSDDEIRKGGKT